MDFVYPPLVAIGQDAPIDARRIGVVDCLDDPLAVVERNAESLRLHEQARSPVQEQCVIDGIVLWLIAVLVAHLGKQPNVPSQRFNQWRDEGALVVSLGW